MRPRPGRGGDPAVHRVTVRRGCGLLPHPVQPAGGLQRCPEPGEQPAAARGDRDQLPGGPVVRHGADDDATADRDPGGGVRALDQRLGVPAGQRHPQQLHRTLALHGHERRALGHHDPAEVRAQVVPLGVEHRLGEPAGGAHPAQRGVPADEVHAVGPQVGLGGQVQRAPVGVGGVVAGRTDGGPALGDPAQVAAVGPAGVDVGHQVTVRAGVPGGHEHQLGARRVPGDVGVVVVPGGDLDRLGHGRCVVRALSGQLQHEDVPTAVGGEPQVVGAVLERGDQPGWLGRGVHAVGGAVATVLGHPGGVGDPPGVRRPDRGACPERVVGEPAGRATPGGQHVQLRAATGFGTQEGQPAPVRGEAGRGVPVPVGQRPGRCGGVGGHGPELAAVLVGVQVQPVDRDDGGGTVRGDRGDAGRAEQGEIGRPHARDASRATSLSTAKGLPPRLRA